MASRAVDGNLGLVAAALSALTEKHIVPKQEYDQIKEKIRRGEEKNFVCKGEVNVVEEIKVTYTKTAELVALKHQGESKQLEEIDKLSPEIQTRKTKKFKLARIKSLINPLRKRSQISRSLSTPLDTQTKNSSQNIETEGDSTLNVSTKNIETLLPSSTSDILRHPTTTGSISRRIVPPTTKRMTLDFAGGVVESTVFRYSMSFGQSGNQAGSNLLTSIDYFPGDEMGRCNIRDGGSDTDSETESTQSNPMGHVRGNSSKKKTYKEYSGGYSELHSLDEYLEKPSQISGNETSSEDLGDIVVPDHESLLGRGDKNETEKVAFKKRYSQESFQTSQSDRDSDSSQEIYQDVKDTERLLPENSEKGDIRELQPEKTIDINNIILLVVLPTGKTIVVTMESKNSTISHLKEKINIKIGSLVKEQVLYFGANLLRDDATLKDYGIVNNSTIHMSLKIQGGSKAKNVFYLDPKNLDQSYDYDFTNMTDDGTKYWRGGHQYSRPYGWNRYAIKVLGKYNNDKWLVNTSKENGEWAVSYHGTHKDCFNPICKNYKIGSGDVYGKGVYSSPLIKEALPYATAFTYNGVAYKGIFQNRVNPNGIIIVNDGKFWVCSNKKDIRPYGLCVKKSN